MVEHKHYIYGGSGPVAIYTLKGDGTSNTRYLHKDHLGSVDTVTSETGAILERYSYDAFGKRRLPNGTDGAVMPVTTHHGYTGHEHLDGLGLIHMNGRVYDPALGRFTQADSIVQYPESTQGFNRYSYTDNNPLSRLDLSGNNWWSDTVRGVVKVVVAVVIAVFSEGDPIAAPFVAALLQSGQNDLNGHNGPTEYTPVPVTVGTFDVTTNTPGYDWTYTGPGIGIFGGANNSSGGNYIGYNGVGGSGSVGTSYSRGSANGARLKLSGGTSYYEDYPGLPGLGDGGSCFFNDGCSDAIEPVYLFESLIPVGAGVNAARTFGRGLTVDAARGVTNTEIRFGTVENQVSHAFRHVEKAGLDREVVRDSIRGDLLKNMDRLPDGLYEGSVNINGVRLDYNAYRLPDGTINVGRITTP